MDHPVVKRRLEWMKCNDRLSVLFRNGVNEFLDFAFSSVPPDDSEIPCPCKRCNNSKFKTRKDVEEDLIVNGIVPSYVHWLYHGECAPPQKRSRVDLRESDDMHGMIRDAFGPIDMNISLGEGLDDYVDGPEPSNMEQTKSSTEVDKYRKLMEDAKQSLYPGCDKFSKLSFIIKLFHFKCVDGMTNKGFTNILKLFKEALPKGADFPSTYDEARKMIRDLGFDYVKIDACENDCMLFWKEYSNLTKCKFCDTPRWKEVKVHGNKGEASGEEFSKIPRKVLRYFPLKERLQRLYMSLKTEVLCFPC